MQWTATAWTWRDVWGQAGVVVALGKLLRRCGSEGAQVVKLRLTLLLSMVQAQKLWKF